MKKCIFIVLLFSILLNSTGYLFLFLELQKQNRKEMLDKISSAIPDDELIKITVLKSSFPGWQSEDEFEFRGNMYDVVKVKDDSKYVIFYCLNDEKEKSILNNLNKHTDQEKNRANNSSNSITQLLIFSAILNKNFSLQKNDNLFGEVIASEEVYNSIISDIASPPPRYSFI